MAAQLRYVDPNRPRGLFTRMYAALVGTRAATFVSALIGWRLDPRLLRATRGRIGTGLTIPTAVLETQGAKSGACRRHAVIYFHDRDRITIVAAKAGAPTHPAWYHNLVAHPDVTLGGVRLRAVVVDEQAERDRLWVLAQRVFPAFAKFRRQAAAAGRTIPIVQLVPRS